MLHIQFAFAYHITGIVLLHPFVGLVMTPRESYQLIRVLELLEPLHSVIAVEVECTQLCSDCQMYFLCIQMLPSMHWIVLTPHALSHICDTETDTILASWHLQIFILCRLVYFDHMVQWLARHNNCVNSWCGNYAADMVNTTVFSQTLTVQAISVTLMLESW